MLSSIFHTSHAAMVLVLQKHQGDSLPLQDSRRQHLRLTITQALAGTLAQGLHWMHLTFPFCFWTMQQPLLLLKELLTMR